MRLELARSAGFCYGVRRAVELAELAADREKPCYMLGPVIHNDHVTAHLEEKGIVCLPDVRDIPPGAAVILRSHGEGRAVYDALAAKGCKTIDAACPNVTKIHRLVERAEESGRQPVIIGVPTHPEVVAIAGWCRSPVVLEDADALGGWLDECPERRSKALAFVSQKSVQTLKFLIQYAVLRMYGNRRHRNWPPAAMQ